GAIPDVANFFILQAEDGIRDFHVTGVQTCALPILPTTPRPLPFRMLASVVDITTGDDAQTLRILREVDPENPVRSLDETRPRLRSEVRRVGMGRRWREWLISRHERKYELVVL